MEKVEIQLHITLLKRGSNVLCIKAVTTTVIIQGVLVNINAPKMSARILAALLFFFTFLLLRGLAVRIGGVCSAAVFPRRYSHWCK